MAQFDRSFKLKLHAGGLCIGLLLGLGGTGQLSGHADIHERIADATQRIEREPDRPELYLQRGELHRAHRDWDQALADYNRAAELDPRLKTVFLVRGRMHLEAGRPQQAVVDLDRFLQSEPNHREALLTRARVLVKLGRRLEATADYTNAIRLLEVPSPEYYLERAQALAPAGERYIPQALEGLDEGIERLGPLVTLQLYAIELELRRRNHARALDRLEQIAHWLAAERHLFRRGEILHQAGREREAQEAFSEALRRIESLPARKRNSTRTAKLEVRLRALLLTAGPE